MISEPKLDQTQIEPEGNVFWRLLYLFIQYSSAAALGGLLFLFAAGIVANTGSSLLTSWIIGILLIVTVSLYLLSRKVSVSSLRWRGADESPTEYTLNPNADGDGGKGSLQQSIARIHQASQVPPFTPHEYRLLFRLMADEIGRDGPRGVQTLKDIEEIIKRKGIEANRNDIRFVYEVIGETDPWFEREVSADLFATRFRNFVVAKCRLFGLKLADDELDLIEAWFPPQSEDVNPLFADQESAQAAKISSNVLEFALRRSA